MTNRELEAERLDLLPRRLETKKISAGNANVAIVGQSNASAQVMGLGIFAVQANYQSNWAGVNQHN